MYPSGLKQLDLSHNNIYSWPSVYTSDSFDGAESPANACFSLNEMSKAPKTGTYLFFDCYSLLTHLKENKSVV